ncbi:MAG TPA: M36 family metallopeptidase [Kofleriaceae bacterium]|nr:M36 family metallopeptidase [Kofleriaceae bacterium]
MQRLRNLLVAALPAVLFASDAGAVRAPDGLDERTLEPAVGRARKHAPIDWNVPRRAAAAWSKLRAQHGQWQAIWDHDRGAPSRVWGEGIAAPGANADAAIAERAARGILAEQLALLAPGTKLADWTLVTNVTHGRAGDLRTVAFVQRHDGVAVLGGQVSFLFKKDRLALMSSAALPDVKVGAVGRVADDATVSASAQAWIAAAYGGRPTVLAVASDVVILPLVRERDDGQPIIEYRTVRTAGVDLDAPRARWDVYVDAQTGAPVARRQTLSFGTGTLRFDAPQRYPAGGRMAYAASQASIVVDTIAATSDATGVFSFNGNGTASVNATVTGTRVRVTNNGQAGVATTLSVPDGGSATWNASSVVNDDAQLAAFVHANLIKTFAKAELAPSMAWLDSQLVVVANEGGSCNAYSTGDDIHFFRASTNCENTARLADVVYHEFGHSLHNHAVISGAGAFDTHMSEGVSDYLAATYTDDPGMGRGFFQGQATPLRHIDPSTMEYTYPDDMDDDPHASGMIIAGALWDLRKDLVAQLGAEAGRQKADDFYMAVLARGSEIPTAYPEILAADDDDGNLANGTPNKCAVDRAFTPHGLVDPAQAIGLGTPARDGFTVTQRVTDPPGGCPAADVASVTVYWRLKGASAFESVSATMGGDTFTADIPAQANGAIVQYRVSARLDDGTEFAYPQNPGDPNYEFYVGPLVPVYCTDFESDPFASGWTHAATGGTSEWVWGVPEGQTSNGDPGAAASGSNVVGLDLGLGGRDGVYEPDMAQTLTSPVIDVTGRFGVRLQYRRWLNVEDGFYDDATILADDQQVWANFAGQDESASTHHKDREWRLHDVDLETQAADGSVQVKFTLESDGGLEMGGWTIDDFCIMARGAPGGTCGDGTMGGDETCDDGNLVDGDGCSATCVDETGGGGCCSTGGGSPAMPIGVGLLTALALLRPVSRRRRSS